MSYSVAAKHVFWQDDEFSLMIGFADDNIAPTKYVILQKAHSFDEQDRELGMDKVHIQVEDESRSQYGGILKIEVGENSLSIELDSVARSYLKVNDNIEILLQDKSKKISDIVNNIDRLAAHEFPVIIV